MSPRIVFKPGPTGAWLHAEHLFDPMVCRIIAVAAETAPQLRNNVLVVTEAYRKATPGRRDLHAHFRAFDFRTGVASPLYEGAIVASPNSRIERFRAANRWSERMAERLGKDCDVIFGPPNHVDHIHAEFDVG